MRIAPRELRRDDGSGGPAGVDRPGVRIDQGVRPREPLPRTGAGTGQAVIVTQQIHQVARISRVENRQPVRQAERLGVHADQPVGDGVERAAPQLARRPPVTAQDGGAGEHVGGRPAGERQQQDPRRVGPVRQQLGDPGRERARLSGACSGQHDECATGVRSGGKLRVVEPCVPFRLEHECDRRPRSARRRAPRRGRCGLRL